MAIKLQIIMPDLPKEFGKGYQKLVHHRIGTLSENFDLKIISITPTLRILDNYQETEHDGLPLIKYHVGLLSIFLNIFLCIFYLRPLQTALYKSRKLEKLIYDKDPHFNIFYLSRTFFHQKSDKSINIIEFVDSMEKNFRSRANSASGLWWLFFKYEAITSKYYDRKIASIVSLATAVSEDDAGRIADTVNIAPIGVDNVSSSRSPVINSHITFSGNMNYGPNIDAVLWFYNNVWVLIKNELPKFSFKIVGANPTGKIRSIAQTDETVVVTGYVKSVIDEISNSHIIVAPMQSGSGMQFKILEAMANNVPVITTRKGLGDIKASPGTDLLIANTADEYLESLRYLIENPEISAHISQKGKAFIARNHLWIDLNSIFLNKLLSLNTSDDGLF